MLLCADQAHCQTTTTATVMLNQKERRPLARPALRTRAKTIYMYRNITVAGARREGGAWAPSRRGGVRCRNARCYHEERRGFFSSLLEVAGGARLGGCLAVANGDGCVDCDHFGEDVEDGLGQLAI